MKIETKRVSELTPASYNPRKKLKRGEKRFNALAKSLEEFGLVQPLVWNALTGRLVGGHQRLDVLKSRGVEEVEVVVVELEEAREKALNVALNNNLIGGEWDVAALETLVAELADLPGFDVTLTGFTEKDLRDWTLKPVEMVEPIYAQRDQVEVTLVMSKESWNEAERDVDAIVRQYQCEVHIKS
ncbi:ParB N-terminal domain-containing protein [Lacunimicrobium album]